MANAIESIQSLVKALEAGGYNAAPSTLTQGAALQVEDLSPVMQNVTFGDKQLILQQMISSESCKSTLAQFDRQLSYGIFGGSAQLEGNVGQEETSDFVRITVPMCFYSHTRRVTMVANMVETVDGKKAEERAAADAAKKLAGDIEFDLFRGRDDFSNAGVFDGNPLAMPLMPNMFGIGVQVRQSDGQRNAHDLMFGEYGSDESVVIPVGKTLGQANIEDSATRSAMNHGSADKLVVDPKALSAYNKITYGKERIVLAGSPQAATGAELKDQWTSQGTVSIAASRFLSGKTRPQAPRSRGPLPPDQIDSVVSGAADSPTSFKSGDTYWYFATSQNEIGESPACAAVQGTVTTNGDGLTVTINHPGSGTVRYFNVYRAANGAAASTAKYIGRVLLDSSGGGTTDFIDLNNKVPGFVTGYLLEKDTMTMKSLAEYSRLKLAVTDLSTPEAYFRFTTLCVFQPRRNVILDNIVG